MFYFRSVKIEARIVHRSFTRDTQAGKVFDLILQDETAAIRMTVFGTVPAFEELLSNLKVQYILLFRTGIPSVKLQQNFHTFSYR